MFSTKKLSTTKFSWLRYKQHLTALLAVEGIGRRTVERIQAVVRQKEATLADFWAQPQAGIWLQCRLNRLQKANLTKFQRRFTPEDYLGWVQAQDMEVVIIDDKNYPNLLKNIDDPPFILYTKGDILAVNHRPIAVVGTRQISGYGCQVIEQLVPNLVADQVSVVSGFMYGVDTYAQQTAVQHGGYTLSVLGFGFDYMYPASNRAVMKDFLAKGNAFVTEYPPWVGSHRGNFRERNRIVAGLSWATLVVEAGRKSGSHITARLAGEYGRGVCAVPGPITNPYSEGTKWLLTTGARLVTNSQEVVKEAVRHAGGWADFNDCRRVGVDGRSQFRFQGQIGPSRPNLDQDTAVSTTSRPKLDSTFASTSSSISNQKATQPQPTDPAQRQVYHQLTSGSLSSDELSGQLQIPISTLNSILSMLELEGWISQQGGVWLVEKIDDKVGKNKG